MIFLVLGIFVILLLVFSPFWLLAVLGFAFHGANKLSKLPPDERVQKMREQQRRSAIFTKIMLFLIIALFMWPIITFVLDGFPSWTQN